MYFFFVDDSMQNNPSRPGMGPIIALGGIRVRADYVSSLESSLQAICDNTGFPQGEEFKWSPGRELWMRDYLVEESRSHFFIKILEELDDYDVVATVVLEDANCNKAEPRCSSSQEDVTLLFLERVQRQLQRAEVEGIIIADRPSGGRSDEDNYLFYTLESIQQGTSYVGMDNIMINVVSTPSKYIRLLQAADLVTSCITNFVCGESNYSPPVFKFILPLLDKQSERIGGFGLKIHPDYKYMNLYYWLLNDDYCRKGYVQKHLPNDEFPYKGDEWNYR